jgi:hypothetical protein
MYLEKSGNPVDDCVSAPIYKFEQKGERSPEGGAVRRAMGREIIRGRCYDQNFLRFSPKNGVFLKNNVMIKPIA